MLFPFYIGDNKNRFLLGTEGNNTLVAIGLNPSTATDTHPDPTITRVIEFSHRNKYDSFVMFNLYPFRTQFPHELPVSSSSELQTLNKKIISDHLSHYGYSAFLVCWGDNINLRPYLSASLLEIWHEIKNYIINSFCLGSLTISGNPRHPGRLPYNTSFNRFDFASYIKSIRE